MKLRERIAERIGGDKYRQNLGEMRAAAAALQEMARWQPVRMRDAWEQVESLLQEGASDQYLDFIRRMMLSQKQGSGQLTESDRKLAVTESRVLYNDNPVGERCIDIWTDFAYGTAIEIVARDDTAQETWEEFWTSRRNSAILNERDIHEHSQTVLTDGEFWWLAFVSQITGESTLRVIPTDEIEEIVTLPNDAMIPLYYKRVFAGSSDAATAAGYVGGGANETVYYPDWRASAEELEQAELPADAVRGDQLEDNTLAVAMHVAHRRRTLGGRGWPLMLTGAAWARAYRDFLQNRAAVARAVAMVVDKIKLKTGSRGVADIINRFESSLMTAGASGETNPPAVAGSTWTENEAAERTRMPLTTGAGDARWDGLTLLSQAGLGAGVPPHLLGRPDAMQNRAVADSTMEGAIIQWRRYNLFWSSVWRELVDLVLTMKERFTEETFETHEADVSSDNALLQIEIDQVLKAATALGTLIDRDAIGMEEATAMAMTLMRLTLQALGVRNVEEVFEPATELGHPGHPDDALWLALSNYRSGAIDADTLAEFAIAEMADR